MILKREPITLQSWLFFLLLASTAGCRVQSPTSPALPLKTGSEITSLGWETKKSELESWLTSLPHAVAKSELSPVVTADARERFANALLLVTSGVSQDIEIKFRNLGYSVEEVTLDRKQYIRVVPENGNGVHATVVLSAQYARNIIVEVPHPAFEQGTVAQAARLLATLQGRALIMAGAHRCASSIPSSCSGKTAVCSGTSTAYSVSDVAHNVDNYFHAAHQALATLTPPPLFVQLHQMKPASKIELIISDASLERRQFDSQLTGRLRDEVNRLANAKSPVAVSCNDTLDLSSRNFRPLCGTANVQARSLAQDADACKVEAPLSSGRFIHLEQSYVESDERSIRTIVIKALTNLLPLMSD